MVGKGLREHVLVILRALCWALVVLGERGQTPYAAMVFGQEEEQPRRRWSLVKKKRSHVGDCGKM